MHPSSVDIENEFSEIALEVGHLARRLDRLATEVLPAGTQEEWEATLVCASAAEKIYSGCERIMARLATEVDRSPVAHSDGWHAALLRRMANPFPGLRGPIISNECNTLLNKMRAFRHRERNAYGINLQLAIVIDRARDAVSAFQVFRGEVTQFLDHVRPPTAGSPQPE